MSDIFSPQSKVWIYQSSRPFSESEIKMLNEKLQAFAAQWTAHNQQLHAGAKVLEDRFILLMVDETNSEASGCSIDKSVHFMKELEKQMHISLFDRMLVNYRLGDSLQTTNLENLVALYNSGSVNGDTEVYNPLVQTKKELDESFVMPLNYSWMKQFV